MNLKHEILLIEDERNICNFITTTLRTQDYKVTSAGSAANGLSLAASGCPDLILLDLGLPDMDGIDVIRNIREWINLPIIVISARTQEKEKVEALDAGADDYITKPFNILEVKARIKAIMRRMEPKRIMGEAAASKTVEHGDMRLDCEGRRAFIAGREIGLTAKEFELLELLMANPDKVYSRENLLHLVWGADYPGDVRTVDVHVRRLREKIEPNPSEPRYVHTKWGVGYYFQI